MIENDTRHWKKAEILNWNINKRNSIGFRSRRFCFCIHFKQTGSETQSLLMSSDERESRSGSAPFPPPASVSMTSPLGSSRRRLSSSFIPSTEPVRAERQLTWVSTRLGESRSAKHIDNGVAWELFGPIVLVHAASVSLEKDKLISELQESVQLRVCFFVFLNHFHYIYLYE